MAPILKGPNDVLLEVTEHIAEAMLMNKGEYELVEDAPKPKRASSSTRKAPAKSKQPAAPKAPKQPEQPPEGDKVAPPTDSAAGGGGAAGGSDAGGENSASSSE